MAIIQDFMLIRGDDAVLEINLTPPVAIGGWTIHTRLQKRFGDIASGILDKWMASGRYSVSGMNIVNSGQGIFNVAINAVETSGLDYGNYAYSAVRTDSGNVSVLTQGFCMLMP